MPKLQLTSPNGGTLNTAGTYCESDIEIIPKLQDKTVTESGTVTADEGYVGLGSVTVEVTSGTEPKLQEKTVTTNGEVTADSGYDGLSKVTVNVDGGISAVSTAIASIVEPIRGTATSTIVLPVFSVTSTAIGISEQ